MTRAAVAVIVAACVAHLWTWRGYRRERAGRGRAERALDERAVEYRAAFAETRERLAHQAFHDALTGLPNRALFNDRLEHAFARAQRRRDCLAVLFLDLDRFKVVNDSLGHAVGDHLLVAVADRLRALLRPQDTAARFGGDEFTVLLEGIADNTDALRVADRVLAALGAPFIVDGHETVVSASIGIAVSALGQASDDLLRKADVAMYAAKDKGKARYAMFDDAMNAEAMRRFTLDADLRRAIERHEFVVYYQPIADLSTNKIVGMEALVRWQHPQRGLLGPDAFIALAEETGLILSIGTWVLREACRQGRLWQEDYADAAPTISVNLCVRQFTHPDLVASVARILHETGFDPRRLILEITESDVMGDAATSITMLRALQGLGVRVAIDDFGTGYSSLSYLKRFPVDTLKVDRSFIGALDRDPEDTAIVQAVVTLGKTLGMTITAEGIETADLAHHLRAMGCDHGQGYYYWRPQPSVTATRFLAEDRMAPDVLPEPVEQGL